MKTKLMRTTFEINKNIWHRFIQSTSYIRRDKFLSHCIDIWINYPFIKSIKKNSNTTQAILKSIYWNNQNDNTVKTNIFLNANVSKNLTKFCKTKGITRNIFFNALIEWLLNGSRDIGGSPIGKVDELMDDPVNAMKNDWGVIDNLSVYRLDKIFYKPEEAAQAYLDSMDFDYLKLAISKQFDISYVAAGKSLEDLTIEEIIKIRNKPVIKQQIDLLVSVSSSVEISFDDLLKD